MTGNPKPTREQLNAYRAAYRYARRDAFFAGKSCRDCGTTEGLRLRNTATKQDLSTIWDWRSEMREATLARCVVLCRRCWDADVQRAQRQEWEDHPHGLLWAYQKHCTCQVCRAQKWAWRHYWRWLRWKFRHVPEAKMPQGVIDPLHVKEVLDLIAGP